MKIDQQKKAVDMSLQYLKTLGLLILANLMLTTSLLAADFSLAGESATILRMRTTTDDKDLYPLYEYLRLNSSTKLGDGSSISLYLGAWGRLDLGETTDDYTDADLQYGYLSYQGAKSNVVVNMGRQFVSEGVASEKLDGIYLRSDLIAGVSAVAFVGKPVLTETDYRGADLVYGTRISHSMPKYYNIGISALKNEDSDSSRYREEMGIDLWAHPLSQVDLTGRSSYNSITHNWMEHAYVLTLSPLDNLKINTNITNINYTDYFHNVTTKALSLTNGIITPGEAVLSFGLGSSFTFLKDFTVSADYKNYSYDIAGNADYYGGKIGYSSPEVITTGFGYHRMCGENERLRYNEYRFYALKRLGKLEMSVDFIDINYDTKINDVKDSFALVGSAGYEINESLKLGANLEYAKNPDFDRDVRGLVKVTYAFDTKRNEGRGKSEK